jgi:hypothetical protein
MKFLIRIVLALLLYTSILNAQFNVYCNQENMCSPSVGGLTFGSSVCTFFLVGRNVVATNLHCLPESIQKEGASCKDIIKFYMPAMKGYAASVRGCDRVIKLSPSLQGEVVRPDYAFLYSDIDFDRPYLSLSQEGFQDNANYTIYRMTPSETGGSMERLDCKATQNSITNPYFQKDKSALFHFSNCPIVKGNSGSPVVDSSGKVRGVLSMAAESFDKSKSGSGFNFACLRFLDVGLISNPSADCHSSFDKQEYQRKQAGILNESTKSLNESLQKSLDEEAATFHKRNFVEFEFDVQASVLTEDEKKQGLSQVLELVPRCYLADRVLRNKSNKIDFDIALKRWGALMGLDPSKKVVSKLVEKKENYRIEYENKIDQNKELSVIFTLTKSGEKKALKLKSCSSI